jgi:type II secretory pathway component PulK
VKRPPRCGCAGPRARRRDGGVALIAVLMFVFLSVSAAVLFLQRSTFNTLAIGNRDNAARAEALARGGVRLATALLIEDRALEEAASFEADSLRDGWAQTRLAPLELPEGDTLRLTIEDAGARLNLNALFKDGAPVSDDARVYLEALLQRTLDALPPPENPGEQRALDAAELADNLIDYVDADSELVKGGDEDETYLARHPPMRAANRALLSVDELRAVEGFDAQLVDALRPYVTVFPWATANTAINPNTAPPWVLALLYTGSSGDYRFVTEEEVRSLLEAREGGSLLCAADADDARCTSLNELLPEGAFPPPSFTADVFVVESEARAGDAVRTAVAVVDRSELAKPTLLAIEVR